MEKIINYRDGGKNGRNIYNCNKMKTGKKYIRGSNNLSEGEYVIVVEIIILNTKNEILLGQRSENKKMNPLKWETTQGSVKSGEDGREAAVRELNEELGIDITKESLNYMQTLKDDSEHIFKELFWIKKDFDLNQIKFSDGEVVDAKWVTLDEFQNMNKLNELANNMDFDIDKIHSIIF